MRPARTAALLAGHALHDGAALAPVLEQVGGRAAVRAAALVRAGELARGLQQLGIDSTTARAAEIWPASLRAGLKGLDALPSLRAFQVRLVSTLGYLWVVLALQVAVLLALHLNVQILADMLPGSGAGAHLGWMVWTGFGGLAGLSALPLFAAAAVFRPEWLPGLGRWRRRAGRAALALGALSSAPPEVARGQLIRLLAEELGAVEDQEVCLQVALSRCRAWEDRILAWTRIGGLTALVLVALTLTRTIYSLTSWLPA